MIFIVDKLVEWFKEFSLFIQDEEYVGQYNRCTKEYKKELEGEGKNCTVPLQQVKFGNLIRDLYNKLRNTVIVKSTTDNSNIIEASLRQGVNIARK